MLGSDKFPLVQMAGEYSSLIRLGYDLINYQDMQCVENCHDPDPTHHVLYEQPVWQTLQMFRTHYISSLEQAFLTTELVGEMLCQSHTLKSSLRNPSSCAICIFFSSRFLARLVHVAQNEATIISPPCTRFRE